MDLHTSPHPNRDQLVAYSLGKLDDVATAFVVEHLERCAPCQKTVEQTPSDTFLHAVQAARPACEPVLPAELANHPRFRIVRELGRGGMGVVYLAEHRLMERLVAIKIISPSLFQNPETVERFHREVRTAAKLDHPNIVRAYDAEQAGELHLLVMEYVEGRSLAEEVECRGPLPAAQSCHYIWEAALALQHAFEKGMVHRDLKPHNLMLLPDKGMIKVLDFGLARLASERQTGKGLTKENMVMGTPEYIAPEQATDAARADIRADIYSLGCTLYCLLGGRPPFAEPTAMQTVLAHLYKEAAPLHVLRGDLPAELCAVVARMICKDPAQRYQTPIDLAAALGPFCEPCEISAKAAIAPSRADVVSSPAASTEKKKAKHRAPPERRRRRAIILAAVAAAVVLVLALAMIRHMSPVVTSMSDSDSLLVTSAADSGPGSLRDILLNAPAGSTVRFGVRGTIGLTSGPLNLHKDVVIDGPGADVLSLSGNKTFPVLQIGPGAVVELSGLTITEGWSPEREGGGIQNNGKLAITRCTIAGNSAGRRGGGIYNSPSATLTLSYCLVWRNSASAAGGGIHNAGDTRVSYSTFSGNGSEAADGGAIFNDATGRVTVRNSTLSGNGGPGAKGGGVRNDGRMTVEQCTIAGNTAHWGGGFYNAPRTWLIINRSTISSNISVEDGGGIHNEENGELLAQNTLVAGNRIAKGGSPDIKGELRSLGHNLIGTTSGSKGFGPTDRLSADPRLGSLRDNGGPTHTMALLPGSAAMNAGDDADAPPFDQRGPGYPRIVGGQIDIGAFQTQPARPDRD